KAFRVFINRTRIVEENLHVRFSENTPNIAGSRPNWLFDIEALTKLMNYKLVIRRNQSNGNAEVKNASTPMETQKPLLKDKDGKEVDFYMYRSMIGSLMYLTSLRPDIMFIVCACARYQVNLKCKKQTVVVNSTTKAEYVAASSCCGQVPWIQNQLLDYRKQKPRKTKIKDTQVPRLSMPIESITDEAVSEEMNDRLVRAATMASSLEADQVSGDIAKTQSKTTPNESSSQENNSGGCPRCQDIMRDAIAQTRVLAVKAIKTTQAQEINSLKMRVKKLEKNQRLRTYKLKRLYKVGLSTRVKSSDDEGLGEEDASKQERIIDDLDTDEDITLVNNQEMFDADKDLQGEEVVVKQEVVIDKEPIIDVVQVSVAATTVTINDITLAKALEALKTSKPNIRGIVIMDHEEPSKSRTTTIYSKKSQGKGKAKIIKEPMKLKKKDQILFDEEVARKLQEKINEEERLVGERAGQEEKVNITLIETWKDIQKKVDADY
nr:hypothetical protein [Tanacetum cinerariifolium]